MTRWIRSIAGVFFLLTLSGCGLRAWVDVDIAEDSTGTVVLQLASDQELRDGMAAFSPDADPVAQLTEGLEERQWIIEAAPVDGEWEGVVATHAFADLDELSGLLGEAMQGGGSRVEIVETSDGYSLSAELGPPTDDTNQADLLAQASEVVDVDGRLSVRFPGEVVDSNGAISDDGLAVTWTYDEQSLSGLIIEANAKKASSANLPLLLGGAGMVLLGVVGLVVWNRRRTDPDLGPTPDR